MSGFHPAGPFDACQTATHCSRPEQCRAPDALSFTAPVSPQPLCSRHLRQNDVSLKSVGHLLEFESMKGAVKFDSAFGISPPSHSAMNITDI